MTSTTTIANTDAGLRPCTPEAHQRAGVDRDDLAEVLDSLLSLEELLSNSSTEVQPERLAALLHLITDRLSCVLRDVERP